MSSEVRCNGCRAWFDKFLRECPECGQPRPEFNSWLRAAQLNENLNAQARRAHANR